MSTLTLWGVKWSTYCKLDGRTEYLMWDRTGLPALFRTRAAAQAWIKESYGYIAKRADLRREPHGWRVPRAVRVKVIEQ